METSIVSVPESTEKFNVCGLKWKIDFWLASSLQLEHASNNKDSDIQM